MYFRVTGPVGLQTAGPLSAAMGSWVEGGQHALVVDADFPDCRQPLIKLVHILVRRKRKESRQQNSVNINYCCMTKDWPSHLLPLSCNFIHFQTARLAKRKLKVWGQSDPGDVIILQKHANNHRPNWKGHLALDVDDVQLPVVVLGDELHHVLLLEGIFIHPLHSTHALDGN